MRNYRLGSTGATTINWIPNIDPRTASMYSDLLKIYENEGFEVYAKNQAVINNGLDSMEAIEKMYKYIDKPMFINANLPVTTPNTADVMMARRRAAQQKTLDTAVKEAQKKAILTTVVVAGGAFLLTKMFKGK